MSYGGEMEECVDAISHQEKNQDTSNLSRQFSATEP